MDKQRYMISDAAALVNVESHVLRYWEEELELTVPRNEMGHRYYTKENIEQFMKIKEWKELLLCHCFFFKIITLRLLSVQLFSIVLFRHIVHGSHNY